MMKQNKHPAKPRSHLWPNSLLLVLIALLAWGCASSVETEDPAKGSVIEPTRQAVDKETEASTKEAPAAEPTSCVSGETHPLAEGIANDFDVEYETVINWFCQDYTFDDILLALQTSDMTEEAPEDLLTMRDDLTWDEIWDELGVTAPEASQ